MTKICIITPGTIASNPRFVKEANALCKAGYKVHLLYTRHVDYLIKDDQQILDSNPGWTYDYLNWAGTGLHPRWIKLLTGFKSKIARLILISGLYPKRSAGYLMNRFYFWQLRKAVACNADLYIAHYPNSLPIAALAAQTTSAFYAFDAEDFHRGEEIPAEQTRAIIQLEELFLPKAAYISASSPLIAEAYKDLFPSNQVTTIHNMFPLSEQPAFESLSEEIFKFFWFSQTIGPHRGLEQIILILGLTGKRNIQLTLLGNCAPDYQDVLQTLWKSSGLMPEKLVFLETVPEEEIFTIAARHHFGLATEVPCSLNRDICLTNKIYTYILSGNYLILSDTRAQKKFHDTYPSSGSCIELNELKSAAVIIAGSMDNAEELNRLRRANYELGLTTLNFDREKEILLKQVAGLWD